MKKYVMIICRGCGNIQCFTEDYYNTFIKNNKKYKTTCIKCGNGNVYTGMKEIIAGIKNDFKVLGLTEFHDRGEFEIFSSLIKNNIDKGFEIVHVESEKD